MNGTLTRQAANQHDLGLRIARLRALLEHALGRGAGPVPPLPVSSDQQLVIPQLAAIFGLSRFETELLVLCAAVELDSQIASLCAELHGDQRRPQPSFGLALTVLPDCHWSALTPGAPLRFWNLVTPGNAELLARAPLAIDERILHRIAGVDTIDAHLAAICVPPERLPAGHMHQPIAEPIAQQLQAGTLVMLTGMDRHRLIQQGAAAVRQAGYTPYLLQSINIPEQPDERRQLAQRWAREAMLTPVVLVLDVGEQNHAAERVSTLIQSLTCPIILVSEHPLVIDSLRPIVRHTLTESSHGDQLEHWAHALGPHVAALNGTLPRLVAQFQLPPVAIHAAVAEALSLPPAPEQLPARLWAACRQQARPRLDDLAQRVMTSQSWEDLVLPARQLELLHEITAHVGQRQRVFAEWGFGMNARGTGTSVIFAGGSGTGKTLAAEILANQLQLDLYRIDLSGVVSKYIGETEKNLRRIFRAAEYGGAILLFDEADALFGKRSEVRDSHDRYANIEVSYLLQQIEQYCGLAILTTNMLDSIDRAFLRRVRFVVQFPFPAYEERIAIWQRAFPAAAPTEQIDLAKLARLNVTGGNIRTIALNAAFLAAQAHEPIGMPHLLRAAVSEYAKLEKALPDSEIRDWIPHASANHHRY